MKSILKKIKELVKFACAAFYFVYLKLFNKRVSAVVIFYHGIRNEDVAGFSRQMEYLANTCTVIKPSEIKAAFGKKTDRCVAITFDDAFVNVLKNAVPVLKRHGMSAGVFVPAGNMGEPPRWNIADECLDSNEVVMNQEQILQLHNDGFDIFSHGLCHSILTEIDNDMLKCELKESKRTLEKIIGDEVVGISYPHGAHDNRVCRFAEFADYKLGFTIEPSNIDSFTDSLKIGRTSISPNDNFLKFKLKTAGAYQVTRYMKFSKNHNKYPMLVRER
jgi:peptidoglycan/xylan/chitin deacetylase (PgdA/CDA1 family)